MVEEGGVIRLVEGFSDEAAQVLAAPASDKKLRGEVWCWVRSNTAGLLAPAVRTLQHEVTFLPLEGYDPSPAETDGFRRQVVSWFAPGGPWAGRHDAEAVELLAKGDGVTRRVQWGWMLHDLVLGSAGLATLAVWPWAWEWEQRERKRLRDAALAAGGTCPGCAYSLAGLRSGDPCPECGASPPNTLSN